MIKIEDLTSIVDTNSKQDILDIFFSDPARYEFILNSEDYYVDYDVQEFLKKHESPKRNLVKKKKEYIKEFKKYKTENKDWEFFNRVINDTQSNIIHWRRGKSTMNELFWHQTFLSTYQNKILVVTIIRRKNQEQAKWRVTISMEVNGVSNKVPTHNKIYGVLYNEIIRSIKIQEEKINAEKKVLEKMVVKPQHVVVRTNIFKCYAYQHTLKEVLAVFRVLKPDGSLVEERATAAYCIDCNCFFLMMSEYERVSKKGVLQCQMIEKEQFYSLGLHAIDMAGESVLMQNGYNVKASVGLPDIQRQAILANIIDNKILTPSQILSYLRLFISQKKGLSYYNAAVNKWETDMEFVRLYKENRKERVYINSLTRAKYKKIRE